MKTLELDRMENIEGGYSVEGAICGAGFAGYTTLISWGLGAVAVSGGTILAVGLGIGLLGAAVCAFAD